MTAEKIKTLEIERKRLQDERALHALEGDYSDSDHLSVKISIISSQITRMQCRLDFAATKPSDRLQSQINTLERNISHRNAYNTQDTLRIKALKDELRGLE